MPLINWDKIRELHTELGGEDLDEVIELFLSEVEGTLDLVGGPTRSLEHDMHSLKGAALNLGFTEFSNLCKDGEYLSANGEEEKVDLTAIRKSYAKSKITLLGDLRKELAA